MRIYFNLMIYVPFLFSIYNFSVSLTIYLVYLKACYLPWIKASVSCQRVHTCNRDLEGQSQRINFKTLIEYCQEFSSIYLHFPVSSSVITLQIKFVTNIPNILSMTQMTIAGRKLGLYNYTI